jgi:hypothetical protein
MDFKNNLRTTIVGIIGVLAYIVKAIFGIEVDAEVQLAFVTVMLFLVAFFSKDAGKDGMAARPPPGTGN